MTTNDLGKHLKCYKISDITLGLICYSILLKVILCKVTDHLLSKVILEISVQYKRQHKTVGL